MTAFEFRIQTRWPDFDGLGHLNHAVYHVYLDEALFRIEQERLFLRALDSIALSARLLAGE